MSKYKILQGDVLETIKSIPDNSVHCVGTSPPYWGLRDYGTATWAGGDAGCDHKVGRFTTHTSEKQGSNVGSGEMQAKDICPKCSAKRIDSQIGLERTPQEYVAKMVGLFREVRRVLHPSGVVFLNLGDSYVGGKGQSGLKPKDLCGIPWRVALALQQPYEKPHCIKSEVDRAWMAALVDGEGCISIRRNDSHSNGLDKARCQDAFVPFISIGNNDRELLDRCVAITGYGTVGVKDRPNVDSRGIKSRRINYGWRLDGNKAMDVIRAIYPHLIAKRKQAVICHNLDLSNKNGKTIRGNGALPASEQERREYMKAIVNACNQRQPVTLPDWMVDVKREIEPGWYLRSDIIWAKGVSFCDSYSGSCLPESVTDRPTKAHEYIFLLTKSPNYFWDKEAVKEKGGFNLTRTSLNGNGNGELSKSDRFGQPVAGTRNIRSVWVISPASFKEAHFATFPEDLVKPMVLAGTSEKGVCPKCLSPWERVVEKEMPKLRKVNGTGPQGSHGLLGGNRYVNPILTTTTGWQPTCDCGLSETIPATVLDPFNGAGTTGLVALKYGRDYIGFELNQDYIDMTHKRLRGVAGQTLLF